MATEVASPSLRGSSFTGPTLQDVLEPAAIHGELFDERFGALAFAVSRTLGAPPSAHHTYAIWPSLMDAFHIIVLESGALHPRIVSLLTFDLGRGLTPALIRLTTVVSSLTAQCAYCSGLGCGFGDIFNGAVTVSEPLNLSPACLIDQDRIAARLAVAATKLPARVTPPMQAEFQKYFGGIPGLQRFAFALGGIAFTNTLNTLLGTELDEAYYKQAEIAFPKKTGFSFGIHKFKHKIQSTFVKSELFNKLWDKPVLKKQLYSIQNQSLLILSEIPDTDAEVNSWLMEHFTLVPRYISELSSLQLKRMLICVMVKTIFWKSGSPETANFDQTEFPHISMFDRLVYSYVYMISASNVLLASHFAKAAANLYNIDASMLETAYEVARDYNSSSAVDVDEFDKSPQFTVMLALTYYAARRYHKRSWRLARILANTSSPTTVMAFVTLLSGLSLMHRFSCVVDDRQGFEEVVAASGELNAAVKSGAPGFANRSDFAPSSEEVDVNWADVDIDSIMVNAANLRSGLRDVIDDMEDSLWFGRVEY
ncbi:hypothetical protein HDU82_000773 [Entophlyctis luteolus]|nr:hypothetical protein HDU82_000773 [Entophlyctis luteolus]